MNKKYMFLMVMALVAAMAMNFGVMADTATAKASWACGDKCTCPEGKCACGDTCKCPAPDAKACAKDCSCPEGKCTCADAGKCAPKSGAKCPASTGSCPMKSTN